MTATLTIHEGPMPSRAPAPLLDRDPSPQDIEAERDQPRPGVWAGEAGAGLRALTQDETDALIRAELVFAAGFGHSAEVAKACGFRNIGDVKLLMFGTPPDRCAARIQRGGIDSDPLVRVIARRAWGERDRRWFELRGVRKGDQVTLVAAAVDADAAVAWPGNPNDHIHGVALSDARPGERVDVRYRRTDAIRSLRVSDRLREPPARQGPSESSDEAMFRVEFGFDRVWIERDHLQRTTSVTERDRGARRHASPVQDQRRKSASGAGAGRPSDGADPGTGRVADAARSAAPGAAPPLIDPPPPRAAPCAAWQTRPRSTSPSPSSPLPSASSSTATASSPTGPTSRSLTSPRR